MQTAPAGERSLELAHEALARFDVDAVVAHLSAAVRAFTDTGQPRAAAMACLELGEALAYGMGNLTAGRVWWQRAARLIADEEPCVEQGWVALAAMGCDVGDPEELLRCATLALDRARHFGDLELEMKALADGGLARVQAGDIDAGFAMLDEAMALACGPSHDGQSAAKSVCSFFTACYYTWAFDRADTWSVLLRQRGLLGQAPGGPVFLSNHCASLQGALLCELGRWSEAERLLEDASERFASLMGVPAFHTNVVLAELRIRQGRLVDAEQLLAPLAQSFEGMLPMARLHLARGDHHLARACAHRGLRALGDDRLRAIELLEVLVDAEIAAGDLQAATDAVDDLRRRAESAAEVPGVVAREAFATAHVREASGDVPGAIEHLRRAIDHLDADRAPWRRALALSACARLQALAGDHAAAALDAGEAQALLARLDLVVPADAHASPAAPGAANTEAVLARTGSTWTASFGGTAVQLRGSKGLRYLVELIAACGAERHALDLVDRVEGVDPDGTVDRRRLGDAGPALDGQARSAYRRRIESLRDDIEAALEVGRLEEAEALQAELDAIVAQLASAFGLGGRDRRSASAAERARLNVTRSVRTAIARISEALPEAGASLDRAVRTGTYCCYQPQDGDIRWIVPSELNGRAGS